MEVKIALLSALSEIFGDRFSYSNTENNDLLSIYNRISATISGNPQSQTGLSEWVLESLRKPFFDLRNSCYHLIKGMVAPGNPFSYSIPRNLESGSLWRITKIQECPGFLQLLLNRNSEQVTEGLHLRFEILGSFIRLVNEDPSIQRVIVDVLGSQNYHAIVYYLKQGSIYVPIKATAIVEDSHM